MRRAQLAALSALTLLVLLAPAGEAATRSVTALLTPTPRFLPASVTIAVGDSVSWRVASGAHTVDADDGSFSSGGDLSPITPFTHSFSRAGAFRYYCRHHGGPRGLGMSGVVTVTDAVTTTTSSTTTTVATTTTARPTTTTTARPATTTTSSTSSTTSTSVASLATTTTADTSTSSTDTTLVATAASHRGSNKGAKVVALLLAIGALGAGAFTVIRRMRAT